MNTHLLSLAALVVGLLGQALASGLACECGLRVKTGKTAWFGVALGALLLGLHNGYSIELMLSTGLYDFRAALLAGLAGAVSGLAILLLSRPRA